MKATSEATLKRVYGMAFASIYPLYIAKAKRKGRSGDEVDQVIMWLTGYTKKGLLGQIKKESTLQDFFENAPKMNPERFLIKGTICGVKVEDIKEPVMREIRYMDKLIDELARGRDMEKILRRK